MTAYIIKSCISLLLMFGLYWLLLRREKLFRFNRFFLLFALLFSLVVPFISIHVNLQNSEVQRSIISVLNGSNSQISPELISNSNTSYQSTPEVLKSRIDISQILKLLYFSGVALLLFRFFRNIFNISRQVESSEKINYSGQQLALTDHQINPYCFFNTMFVNKDDYLNGKIAKELLYHEIEHIKQSHSIDVIFIELIQIIYWFNPILLLYNMAIRANHEYLADNDVVRNSSDIKNYSDKLINFACFNRNIPLTTGFNQSLTRNRLIMLTKSKPNIVNGGIRIFLTLNLSLMIFVLMSFKNSDPEFINSMTISKAPEKNEQIANSVKGFVVNKYGKYIEGLTLIVSGKDLGITTDFMGHFLINNVPEDASLTFSYKGYITQTLKPVFSSEMVVKLIIDQESSLTKEKIISTYAPKSGTNPPVVIDGEMHVGLTMKDIDPNNGVRSIIVLEGKDATNKYGEKGKNGIIEILTISNLSLKTEKVKADTTKAELLIVVNGVVFTKKQLDDIPIETIESFSVRKDKIATEKYGEKGKNGVIVVITKK